MSGAVNGTANGAVGVPDFVAPLEVTFPLAGKDITVRPANVAQLARLMQCAGPAVHTLLSLPPDLWERLQGGGITADDLAEVYSVLSDHPETPLELVAIATGFPLLWVQALMPDAFAYLFAVVVQVNADFFSRAAPVFAAAGRVLQQAKAAAPGPSGPASSTA